MRLKQSKSEWLCCDDIPVAVKCASRKARRAHKANTLLSAQLPSNVIRTRSRRDRDIPQAPLAQSAERVAFNHVVVSSSLAGGATRFLPDSVAPQHCEFGFGAHGSLILHAPMRVHTIHDLHCNACNETYCVYIYKVQHGQDRRIYIQAMAQTQQNKKYILQWQWRTREDSLWQTFIFSRGLGILIQLSGHYTK